MLPVAPTAATLTKHLTISIEVLQRQFNSLLRDLHHSWCRRGSGSWVIVFCVLFILWLVAGQWGDDTALWKQSNVINITHVTAARHRYMAAINLCKRFHYSCSRSLLHGTWPKILISQREICMNYGKFTGISRQRQQIQVAFGFTFHRRHYGRLPGPHLSKLTGQFQCVELNLVLPSKNHSQASNQLSVCQPYAKQAASRLIIRPAVCVSWQWQNKYILLSTMKC